MERTEASSSHVEIHPVRSEYDVFLSFRGPDTREIFTDILYEFMGKVGIHVFKDDEEIRRGEEIGGELERAIDNAKIYVIVFSKNYASSAWCLRELAMMVDRSRDSDAGKILLPIFYDADPYDVKLRSKLYQQAIDAHKQRYEREIVGKWEEALLEVGGISGWDSKSVKG